MKEEKTITYREAAKSSKLLFNFETPDYDWEAIEIYQVGKKYAFFTDGGCSCSSAFENEDEVSPLYNKSEMRRIMAKWSNSKSEYDAESVAKAAFGKEWNL